MLISAASYQIPRTSSWLQLQKDLELENNAGGSASAGICDRGLALRWAVFLTEGLTSETGRGRGDLMGVLGIWDRGGGSPQAHDEHRPARDVSHA